jgi:hypothetical protein
MLRRLATLATMVALGGCGSQDAPTADRPSSTPVDEQTVPRPDTSGLLRADAVRVTGPGHAAAGAGGWAPVRLEVSVPAAAAARAVTVEVLLSGCRARPAHRSLRAPAGGEVLSLTVQARPEAGEGSCALVADALVSGRPDTGDEHIVEIRAS